MRWTDQKYVQNPPCDKTTEVISRATQLTVDAEYLVSKSMVGSPKQLQKHWSDRVESIEGGGGVGGGGIETLEVGGRLREREGVRGLETRGDRGGREMVGERNKEKPWSLLPLENSLMVKFWSFFLLLFSFLPTFKSHFQVYFGVTYKPANLLVWSFFNNYDSHSEHAMIIHFLIFLLNYYVHKDYDSCMSERC